MSINKITDTQRLEELTEWCRNKPDEAAVRIMVAEGVGVEPMGRDKGYSVSFKGEPVEGMEYAGIEIGKASDDVVIEAVISVGDLETLLREGAKVAAEVEPDGRVRVRMARARSAT